MPPRKILSASEKAFLLVGSGKALGVFLRAAVDESADGEKKVAYGVGGLFGDQADWLRFERYWKPYKDEMESRGVVFHATDCESQRGAFREWEKADCDRMMVGMANAIIDSKLYYVHTAVKLPDFYSLFPDDRDRSLYYLCFTTIVGYIASLADQVKHPVAFRFDQRPEYAYMAFEIYSELKRNQGKLSYLHWLGDFVFGDRTQCPLLQAADMVAREGLKLCIPSTKGIRIPMQRLGRTGRCCGFAWEIDELKELHADMLNYGAKDLRSFLEPRDAHKRCAKIKA